MRIFDYKSILDESLADLDTSVKMYIQDGWQPQGGIAVDADAGTTIYIQAMVKYTESGSVKCHV